MGSTTPSVVPDPIFFISLTSNCQFNDAFLYGDQKFEEGGNLCAYGKESDVVFACPAGDSICWNEGSVCTGGNDTTPGYKETACSDITDSGLGDYSWCCSSQFSQCTLAKDVADNCWSWFSNPLRYVSPEAASSSASVLKTSAAAQPSLTNILVSTLPNGGYQAIATTSSTSANNASTLTSSSNTSSSISTSTSTSISNHSDDDALTGGAIAGIAVGCVAAGVIVASLGFFLLRRHRKNKQRHQALPIEEKATAQTFSQGTYGNGPRDPYIQPAEMSGQQEGREKRASEMPTHL